MTLPVASRANFTLIIRLHSTEYNRRTLQCSSMRPLDYSLFHSFTELIENSTLNCLLSEGNIVDSRVAIDSWL